MSKAARAVRWGVPIAAVAVVVAAVGTGPVIAAVQGDPSLPDRTAQQLLADAAQKWQPGRVPPMSGTIVETASLGLPALPGVGGGGSSPTSLLSGSHQLKVWYGGPGQARVMLPGEMSETDVIADGDQVWLWDGGANSATHLKIPAGEKAAPSPLPSIPTPQKAAEEALKAAGGNTTISVGNDATVAGRASYELVLTPKAATSLVKDVRVALDGETLIPLRVQVYAKGAAEPAFEVGFDSVTFSPPAPENFTFTPPPGAKVVEGSSASLPGDGKPGPADGARVVGSGWESVIVTPVPSEGAEGSKGSDAFASVLKSATPVSGPWGSGRLLRSKLLSALVTDDGRLIAGAVTPEVLYRAAGAAG
ncbi:outer membrane lipoprotein carrier protein LolA [Planotetraspora sp. GP83]|uniref:LolA family protein n=1 Tax=Planotetraspora sp. GP83 TaxID=3156264 RepID=UPI003512E538